MYNQRDFQMFKYPHNQEKTPAQKQTLMLLFLFPSSLHHRIKEEDTEALDKWRFVVLGERIQTLKIITSHKVNLSHLNFSGTCIG